jgi:hypothetical protein
VFPRLDAKNTLRRSRATKRRKPLARPLSGKAPAEPFAPLSPQIAIDDFAKVDMRVGRSFSRSGERRDKLNTCW